jgi:hypothetical protein
MAYELTALRELSESMNIMLKALIRARSPQKDQELLLFQTFVQELLMRETIGLDDLEKLTAGAEITFGMSAWVENLREAYAARMQQRVFVDDPAS